MKTAIPTQAGKIAPQCDGVPEYTSIEGIGVDWAVENFEVSGDPVEVAKSLASRGISRVLASGISNEMISAFETQGIRVFYGAAGTIGDAIQLISYGILDSMNAVGGCGGSCGSGGSCGCGSHR